MSVASIARTERLQSEYLDSLSQRVRAWRFREGKSYFSMPTPLWDEAVAAARKYGLRSTSKLLGLNRDDLKRRMGLIDPVKSDVAPAAAGAEEDSEDPQFIELPGVAAALISPPVASEPRFCTDKESVTMTTALTAGEAVVEVLAPDGAKLTVRLPVAQLDIASLVHRFRSGA